MAYLSGLSRRMIVGVLAISILAVAPIIASRTWAIESAVITNRDGNELSSLQWSDLNGKNYGSENLSSVKATTFLFTSTQCPIAGRYGARYSAIAKEYVSRGIAFFLVNSNQSDSKQSFQDWAKARNLTLPLVRDDNHALADRLNATTTPQAIVLDSTGKIAYLGAIDDNQDATKVTRQDLKNALDDILSSREVKRPRTRAFGCAIFRDTPIVATTSAVNAKVTYAKDIAPILQKNCLSCHRSGDVAPFPLENYEHARQWASAIKEYTARRLMPPWKATPGHGEFHDSRWLTDDELNKIAVWADNGTPAGDMKQTPKPPVMAKAGDWQLGTPDLVLQPTKPFSIEAEGKDIYRNFALPVDFNEDRYISAFDFQPGNRAIVHHIIAYIDVSGKTVAKREGKESQPGWSVSGGGSGIEDDDWGSGWAPGMNPRRLPDGVAVKIPRGAKLVLQVHYHKSGKPETDQSKVALYYAKSPVTGVVKTAPIGNVLFNLKPNEDNQVVKASMVLPYDAQLWAIMPHMHMLGKEMKVWAVFPDGTEKSLIWVKNWEFNWQMAYRYREPMILPRGTRLNLRALYNNTAINANQPSNPPRSVTYGEQTTDEMCFAFLSFTRMDNTKQSASLR